MWLKTKEQTPPTARRPRPPPPTPPLTFVQPVAEAVEDHALLPRGHHADGLLADVRAVVDVVFKDKYLVWREENQAVRQRGGGKRCSRKIYSQRRGLRFHRTFTGPSKGGLGGA